MKGTNENRFESKIVGPKRDKKPGESPWNDEANHECRRILVFRFGQLGDMLVSLPAMWAIRRAFPNAHIALLSDQHLNKSYLGAQDVFPKKELFNEYLRYHASITGTSLIRQLKMLARLRRESFDTLVYLVHRNRPLFNVLRDLFFFRLIGIKKIIGRQGIKGLPNHVLGEPLMNLEHEADHHLYRLRASGIPTPEAGLGEMDLRLTPAEMEYANSWLAKRCGNHFQAKQIIGIGPGSKWPSKVWPYERFAELGHHLVKKLELFPIVFGGSEDAEVGEKLLYQWGYGANAAGHLNVRHAAAALTYCKFYVGNDTGTMHLSAAVGTPCIAAFSAQDWPGRWIPYGEDHIVIRKTVPCEGCMLRVCNNNLECLRAISVEEMFEACKAVLDGSMNAEKANSEI